MSAEDHHAIQTEWWTQVEARHEQKPPDGDWRVWLFMGGRGAGKTRAGAEWVLQQVRAGRRRIALAGQTLSDVREVMVEGPSGLARIAPPAERPRYEPSRRRLVFPCGAEGFAFSGEDPDSLRGPQFDAAWADEFAAWARPQAALDMLRMGLRLGPDPRLMVTTTPRPVAALKRLAQAEGTVTTRSAMDRNAKHLAPGFLGAMRAAYGGSLLARQELEGLLIDDPPGALWTRAMIEAAFDPAPPGLADFARIVIAVDPPAGAGAGAAECGIVAAGALGEGAGRRAWLLADLSFGPAAPGDWAAAVGRAYREFQAGRVIAEANQGGEMVAAVLRAAAPDLPVKLVRASRGKAARAEPVAALYSAGRVRHAARFAALEDQLCSLGADRAFTGRGGGGFGGSGGFGDVSGFGGGSGFGSGGAGSPDRADAAVWALTELLIPAQPPLNPRARVV